MTPVERGPAFNVDSLVVALDRKRRAERKSWRTVAAEVGVSSSTFSRMGLSLCNPSAEGLTRMLLWLGQTDLRPYLFHDGSRR
jgi:hypothetical protein